MLFVCFVKNPTKTEERFDIISKKRNPFRGRRKITQNRRFDRRNSFAVKERWQTFDKKVEKAHR